VVTAATTLLLVVLACAGGVVLYRLLQRALVDVQRELTEARDAAGTQLAQRNAEMDRRLLAIDHRLDRRLAELDTKVDRRLETATKTTAEIHERLGKVDQATAQMLEQARELSQLQQVLRPPKARGGFGELLLENLLRDRLPPSAYDLQYTFRGGERVDAVIRVDRLVPVDAKFPLDNFERMVAAENDVEREQRAKAFGRDVKGHVDAIASKYVRPDEDTYDFAFMYLPSEAIYYELACGKTGALLAYANENRVFPVSPTTLTAYLQVVALGLRGMQIEQHAREVMAYVAELDKDFIAFRDDFLVVGKHLANAQGRYADAQRRLDRFDAKLERAVEHETIDEAEELPQALDAA
jgi:DNA recombination protein RmuC